MSDPAVESVDCVVIGGGITGLSAAHRLMEIGREREAPLTLRLLEGSDRLGGQIRTERVGDYLIDGGPDSLVTHKPAAVKLAERIGLAGELVALGGRAGGTEVLRNGRPVRVPDGFLMMAPTKWGPVLRSPLFSIGGKLRMAREPWIRPRSAEIDDESLASFVTRRFGREVLERVAEPILAGLYTANAEELSLRIALPRFLEMEAREGSVLRALRKSPRPPGGHAGGGFFAMKGGLGRFVEELSRRLPPAAIETSAPVDAIGRDRARGAWRIRRASGHELRADAIVLACSAAAGARIVRDLDPELASSLTGLEYASCATATVAYPASAVGSPLRSFGFFVPRVEKLPLLACSYVSRKFGDRGPADTIVLRAFLGGAVHPGVLDNDDTALVALAHSTLARLLSIRVAPVFSRVHRFPGSMPQYRPGQAGWIAGIRSRVASHPGLFLAGSALGAIGLPDCTRSGEEAADSATAFLSSSLQLSGSSQTEVAPEASYRTWTRQGRQQTSQSSS